MNKSSKISEYIQRWGCSTSISLLDPHCKIFTHQAVDGMIGYQEKGNYLVVFGDPVCDSQDVPALAEAFHQFSKKQSKEYIYLTASENFSQWAMENGCHGLVESEEELIINPATYPKTGSNGRLLHKKVNHALHANVLVKEYEENEKLKKEILEAESRWIKGRKGPQMFLSHFPFFEDPRGKRCFYAQQDGRVVGVLYLNRLDAQDGWLLYLLMVLDDAPGGTSEYLILSAFDKLAEEKCPFFSFGISAAKEMGKIIGLNKFSAWLARMGFRLTKRIFNLDNRRLFWMKFQPQNRRSFILFSRPRIGIKEGLAVLKSLNVRL
jgi:lysylphosphatidylglycerol synthetase-like protein (DUF2156 family)